MFWNNLKLTFRSLRKNSVYTFINLLGLTIGLACVLLIGLFIQQELSYDQYHPKKDQLYRLAAQVDGASYENGIAKVSYRWGDAALEDIPEVVNRCRFTFFGNALVTKGQAKNYENDGLFADATVFEMFGWQLLEGNAQTALTDPNTLVLTKSLAQKYFPNQNPIGQTLNFDNEIDYTITGVMENAPENSHFTFDFLVSMSTYTHPRLLDWVTWNQSYTYVMVEKGVSPKLVETKMDAVLDQHLEAETAANTHPMMQPITDIHLQSKLHREMAANSDMSYIYIFGAIALFILLIASLNFINLSTARAADRAKEVGVRKVIGASKQLLIQQFLGEAMVVVFIAGILAIFLAHLCLPSLNAFTGSSLSLDIADNLPFFLSLGALTVLMGILSGIYPAFILSTFRPAKVLKGQISLTKGANLKKGLVVFQFAIATFLIIAALIVSNQLHFIQNKNLGFNKEQIIVVQMKAEDTKNKAKTIKTELSKIPGVLNVSTSANRPGGSDYGVPYQAVGLTDEEMPSMRCLVIDEQFLETYDMELAHGRGFSENFTTDSAAYLINETAAKQLGWTNPLEQQLAMPAVGRPAAPIVGVVKDFHFRSLHEKIAPLYFFMESGWYSQFSIKLEAQNINKTLATIEQKWKIFEPNHPFTYRFFDEQFNALHQSEAVTNALIKGFTFLAILITCLGLFALSTYAAIQRRKEIGIRKVLGASTSSIVAMLSKDFLKLVIIALLIATPFAYYFSNEWLQNFAYRINIEWWIFVLAGILSILVAFLTVSYQSVRAALANPIDALKVE